MFQFLELRTQNSEITSFPRSRNQGYGQNLLLPLATYLYHFNLTHYLPTSGAPPNNGHHIVEGEVLLLQWK